jgi:hypothetical protein
MAQGKDVSWFQMANDLRPQLSWYVFGELKLLPVFRHSGIQVQVLPTVKEVRAEKAFAMIALSEDQII